MSKTSKVCLIEWKSLSCVFTVLFCSGCARGFLKAAVVICVWMNCLIFLWVRGICAFHPVSPFRLSLVDLLQQLPPLSGAPLLMVPNKVWVGEQVGLTGLLWIGKRRINCRSKDCTQGLTTCLVILLTFCLE